MSSYVSFLKYKLTRVFIVLCSAVLSLCLFGQLTSSASAAIQVAPVGHVRLPNTRYNIIMRYGVNPVSGSFYYSQTEVNTIRGTLNLAFTTKLGQLEPNHGYIDAHFIRGEKLVNMSWTYEYRTNNIASNGMKVYSAHQVVHYWSMRGPLSEDTRTSVPRLPFYTEIHGHRAKLVVYVVGAYVKGHPLIPRGKL
jgi:hypothetical protein